MPFIKVATMNDLKSGQGMTVEVNGRDIALFCTENGSFYAIDNTCPHKGAPLGEGQLEGNIVTCPLHAWKFDIRTGISPTFPTIKIRTLPVKVENNDIFVEV